MQDILVFYTVALWLLNLEVFTILLTRMIISGPKSYYEEYLRRRDTDRTIAKPPALLTDRNAYINFLEVQLERVSASCLAVQAYDERFNDMQGLIVALEQRCSSTMRLVSVAQQCSEVCICYSLFAEQL
jgi:hypothetical protein